MPFAELLTVEQTEEQLEWRIADSGELVADMAAAAGEKVGKQKVPLAEGKIYYAKPVSAGAFSALRARLARAVPDGAQVEKLVTPITVHRRGKRPVDTFAVVDDEIINDAFGARVFTFHTETNGTAVKLVGPLEFFLTAKRDEAGELRPVKELTVKAHFASLVPDHFNPGQPIFRLDDAAFAYPLHDRKAYKRAMKARLLATPGAPAEFVAWAHTPVGVESVIE